MLKQMLTGKTKSIRITKEQAERWDPELIKIILSKRDVVDSSLMLAEKGTVIIEGLNIAIEMFNEFMHDSEFKERVKEYFSKKKNEYASLMEAIKIIKEEEDEEESF